jgi:hypothetical protein
MKEWCEQDEVGFSTERSRMKEWCEQDEVGSAQKDLE